MNQLNYTLFLSQPELQRNLLTAFKRIHGDLSLEPAIRQLLNDSLLAFAHDQNTDQHSNPKNVRRTDVAN